MPPYAKNGSVLCFFTCAQKFKMRYATFGFSDKANLDDGAMWPTEFALSELDRQPRPGSATSYGEPWADRHWFAVPHSGAVGIVLIELPGGVVRRDDDLTITIAARDPGPTFSNHRPARAQHDAGDLGSQFRRTRSVLSTEHAGEEYGSQ